MTGGGEGFTERGGFIGGGEKGRRRLTGGGGRLIGGGERGQGTPSHMCIYARHQVIVSYLGRVGGKGRQVQLGRLLLERRSY